MKVEIIHSADELDKTEPFFVDQLLWGTKEIPRTFGYLGFKPDDGFYLKMVCEEKNPRKVYHEDCDPVYQDSAVEAFFQFQPGGDRGNHPVYVNFEMNANGALLAAYGRDRTYRTCFTKEERELFGCRAEIGTDSWQASVRIPLTVLDRIYGPLNLKAGSEFTCNFYKISETKEIEHYASYSRIESEIPSFHLTEYFASARIAEEAYK